MTLAKQLMKEGYDKGKQEADQAVFDKGYKEGYKEAIEKRRKEESELYVRNLLSKGFALDEIAEIINEPIEQVRKIKRRISRRKSSGRLATT